MELFSGTKMTKHEKFQELNSRHVLALKCYICAGLGQVFAPNFWQDLAQNKFLAPNFAPLAIFSKCLIT